MPPVLQALPADQATADLAAALRDGSLAAVALRGAWSPDAMAALLPRLQAGIGGLRRQHRDDPDPAAVQVGVYGVPVSPSTLYPHGPDPAEYAPQTDAVATALDGALPGWQARLQALLAACGAPASRAPGYGACTVRHVPVGRGLDRHCENLYAQIPVYAALRERVAILDTCSWFLTVSAPDAGGRLAVYDARWTPGSTNLKGDVGPPAHLAAAPGDLVLLAAGNQYHGVETVGGPQDRWTIGGFWAPRRDGAGVHYWG